MKQIKVSDIINIVEESTRKEEPIYHKKKAIDMYEETETIRVVDSAYPAGWSDEVRKHFKIRNIGDWGWAYGGDNLGFGTPVPCCQQSLLLFKIMINDGAGAGRFIHRDHYDVDEDLIPYQCQQTKTS